MRGGEQNMDCSEPLVRKLYFDLDLDQLVNERWESTYTHLNSSYLEDGLQFLEPCTDSTSSLLSTESQPPDLGQSENQTTSSEMATLDLPGIPTSTSSPSSSTAATSGSFPASYDDPSAVTTSTDTLSLISSQNNESEFLSVLTPPYDNTITVTQVSRSSKDPMKMLINQSNVDRMKQLLLFQETFFNRLVEDNFIQINMMEASLAVGHGLMQLELDKYHELARVVDLLHDRKPVFVGEPKSAASIQIDLVQKHTENLIKCYKMISSFNSLDLEDQISLLKFRFVDLCIVKSFIFIEPETRSLKLNGTKISISKCPMMKYPHFITLLSSIDPSLRADPLFNLFTLLICTFNLTDVKLKSSLAVRKEFLLTLHLTRKYLEFRGFTIDQANYEISTLICHLEDFLLVFNGKQKVQDLAGRHLGYTSQLIAEMLDINGSK